MDPTCDPQLKSWMAVDADCDFSIQNLPFGVCLRGTDQAHVCSAIGTHIVDLAVLHGAGLFSDTPVADGNVFDDCVLNPFMARGRAASSAVRKRLSELLSESCPTLRDNAALRAEALIPMDDVRMVMPVRVGDYTDFYSSKEHATNVGSMFRPDNPLLPNWVHIPVGYHGRASSIVGSGTDVRRPRGQTKADDVDAPSFGPSRLLDFELEMGFFTGVPNELGTPISTARAPEHIFGMVLVNDWSARDIQKWEYVPLGPFLSKSFATSIAPWVVTLDALDPFRVAGPTQEPAVLPYLRCNEDWGLDLQLEVWIEPDDGSAALRVTDTNFRHMYWNLSQQLAHQTVNGVNVRTGDLYASGTVSGPTRESRGSMLEISWRGTEPVTLPNGTQRKFIQDGDSVIMRGWCQGDGYRVGFGEVRNKVVPALTD